MINFIRRLLAHFNDKEKITRYSVGISTDAGAINYMIDGAVFHTSAHGKLVPYNDIARKD